MNHKLMDSVKPDRSLPTPPSSLFRSQCVFCELGVQSKNGIPFLVGPILRHLYCGPLQYTFSGRSGRISCVVLNQQAVHFRAMVRPFDDRCHLFDGHPFSCNVMIDPNKCEGLADGLVNDTWCGSSIIRRWNIFFPDIVAEGTEESLYQCSIYSNAYSLHQDCRLNVLRRCTLLNCSFFLNIRSYKNAITSNRKKYLVLYFS